MYLRCLKRLTDNKNQHLYEYLHITYTLKAKEKHKQRNAREINARLFNNHNNNSKNSYLNICLELVWAETSGTTLSPLLQGEHLS